MNHKRIQNTQRERWQNREMFSLKKQGLLVLPTHSSFFISSPSTSKCKGICLQLNYICIIYMMWTETER